MKIGVVGAGVAGLTASYLLSKKHEVTLIEKKERAGGHTNTIYVEEDGKKIGVDTGFIVFNEKNYPNFCKFLSQLNVESHPSDMSFAYLDQRTNYCYSSDFPAGIFSTRSNLYSFQFYHFLKM